jgi:hypothetical protein
MNFEGIATIWLLVWTWLKMSLRHSLKLIRMSYKTGPKGKKYYFLTAKWIWDRSIYSKIKPSIDMTLFQYFWRFTQICKKFAAFAGKIVFVIASEQFYYKNNNKNNFVRKCCNFLANLCKSSEILDHCHVKWWLKYWNSRSVS